MTGRWSYPLSPRMITLSKTFFLDDMIVFLSEISNEYSEQYRKAWKISVSPVKRLRAIEQVLSTFSSMRRVLLVTGYFRDRGD